MFSLIITILSIALVVALAAVTIYYGGDAFKSGQSKAIAAAVITQGQQVLGATELFKVHKGRWPASQGELVTFGYLQAMPEPSTSIAMLGLPGGAIVAPAFAASSDAEWSQVQTGAPAFWILRNVSESVCRDINLQVRKDNGIYNAAVHELTIQCFGQNANYTVLVHLPPQNPALELEQIVPPNSGTPALQVTPGGGGWSRPPVVGSGSSGGPVDPVEPPVVVVPPTPTPTGATVQFRDVPAGSAITKLTLPSVLTGATSAPAQATLVNTGDAELVFGATPISVVGSFNLVSTTCAGTLPVAQSCAAVVSFAPKTSGTSLGNLTVNSNIASPPTLVLEGVAQQPPFGHVTPLSSTGIKGVEPIYIDVMDRIWLSLLPATATGVANTVTWGYLPPGTYDFQAATNMNLVVAAKRINTGAHASYGSRCPTNYDAETDIPRGQGHGGTLTMDIECLRMRDSLKTKASRTFIYNIYTDATNYFDSNEMPNEFLAGSALAVNINASVISPDGQNVKLNAQHGYAVGPNNGYGPFSYYTAFPDAATRSALNANFRTNSVWMSRALYDCTGPAFNCAFNSKTAVVVAGEYINTLSRASNSAVDNSGKIHAFDAYGSAARVLAGYGYAPESSGFTTRTIAPAFSTLGTYEGPSASVVDGDSGYMYVISNTGVNETDPASIIQIELNTLSYIPVAVIPKRGTRLIIGGSDNNLYAVDMDGKLYRVNIR